MSDSGSVDRLKKQENFSIQNLQECNGQNSGDASDIYSFVATLYAMLCGRPPFCGDNIHATMNMIVNLPPTDVRKLCNTAEDELAGLITCCRHR